MSDDNGNTNITRSEFNQVREMLKDIHKRLLGDENTPGLVIEVDRLKLWVQARAWFEQKLIGGLITLSIIVFGVIATLVTIIIKLTE